MPRSEHAGRPAQKLVGSVELRSPRGEASAIVRPLEAVWHEEDARSRQRWTVAFAVVLVFHLGVFLLSERKATPVEPVSVPLSSAIMIEMAPVPATPPAAPPTTPQPQRREPAKPRHAIKAPSLLPPLPRSMDAAALAVDPQPEPPEPEDKPSATQTPVSPTQAPPAAAIPAQSAAQSAMSAPDWQSLVLGQLERFKRYPPDAQARHQQGVAYLRFTMDRNGRVLGFSLEKSSGYESLDQEALTLIQRAQPLPEPPSSVPGDPLELVVPVEFFLSRRW